MSAAPTTRRLAIIVPGCTDLNRGDQALVWEAAQLLQEMALADDICLLESGENAAERDAQVSQTRRRGFELLAGLLPHPRRGRHSPAEKIGETPLSLLRLLANSLVDFLRGQLLLLVAPWPLLATMLLNDGQWATYQAFRTAQLLAVKGGGFLHAYGSLQDPYYIWYALFHLRLAQRLGKPVVILPNSFGPFRGKSARAQVQRVLSRCACITARESVSAGMLEELLGAPVPVYPDLGYYLAPTRHDEGRSICRNAGIPLGEQPCVAFTLRPYRFPGSPDPRAAFARYLDAMAELVRHVAEQGFHPVLVTHVAGPSAHEDDRLAISELLPRLEDLPVSRLDFPGDCRDIKAVYGCMDYLVGTRFHSVVFAQEVGVPCLTIAYGGNKATGIMHDIGLDDYVLPIDEVTGAELCRRFDQLRAETLRVKALMAAWHGQLPAARARLIADIRNHLTHEGVAA